MKNFSYIHIEKLKSWGRGKLGARSYRQAKYTRHWGVVGCWEHDMRLIETPNADRKRFGLNLVACKESDWKLKELSKENLETLGCRDPEFIEKKAKEAIEEKGVRVRQDQVKVAMLLMAVSPEYLRDGDAIKGKLNPEKVRRWALGSVGFLRKKFGDQLLSVVIHRDESNPHLSAYIVPLQEKKTGIRGPRKKKDKDKAKARKTMWCLSAKSLFTPDPYIKEEEIGKDGKERVRKIRTEKGTCSQLQDEYAQSLREAGLDVRRGVRRAPHQQGLEHETNKIRYERLTAPIEDIKNLSPDELRQWAIDAAPQAEESRRAKIERDHYQQAAATAQAQVEDLEKELQNAQRSLPVAEVLAKLFGINPRMENNPNPEEITQSQNQGQTKLLFILPTEKGGQKISVDTKTNRFENLTPDLPFLNSQSNPTANKRTKGKGAIDAVSYLTGWNIEEATEWIADNFDTTKAKRAIAEKVEEQIEKTRDDDSRQIRAAFALKISKELETPDPSQWEKVAKHLELAFYFPPESFETLRSSNWLSANKFGHLLCTKGRWDKEDDIIPTGKIIIDLNNPEVPLKETGDNGLVFMHERASNEVIFCSNPLDGLALRSSPDHLHASIFVVGENPSQEKTKPAITRITSALRNIKFAENLTNTGRKLQSWFEKNFPKIPILKLPQGFNSWVDFHCRPKVRNPDQHPHLQLLPTIADISDNDGRDIAKL